MKIDTAVRICNLKSIVYETLNKRLCRSGKPSKCVQMLKKRIFNSTEPLMVPFLYLQEEPFGEKPFFAMKLSLKFRRKIRIS